MKYVSRLYEAAEELGRRKAEMFGARLELIRATKAFKSKTLAFALPFPGKSEDWTKMARQAVFEAAKELEHAQARKFFARVNLQYAMREYNQRKQKYRDAVMKCENH